MRSVGASVRQQVRQRVRPDRSCWLASDAKRTAIGPTEVTERSQPFVENEGARYVPVQGRSTQPDPIGLAGGLNLYGYAGGDPINRSDPFGLCAESADSTKVTVQCPDGSQETQYATTSVASAAETAALFQALAAMSYDGAGLVGLLGNAALGALSSSVSGGYGKFSTTSTQGYPVITAAGFGTDGYLYLRDDVSGLATGGGMNAMVPVPTGRSTMSVCTAVGHEGFHAIGMPESMHSAIAVLQGGFRCR